jgi:D-glycero-D-manno-heptose 1,7-bisphosphate phosphatase
VGIGALSAAAQRRDSAAVFLDRDGVLNRHVLHVATGEYEPPHAPHELSLFPWTLAALRRLRDAGYLLFIVSNQPDYAKRKTTLEALAAVHTALKAQFTAAGIGIADCAYCHCHPDSTVEGYGRPCPCRKPSPRMVQQLLLRHPVDPARSWMIGDRGSDVDCGAGAGLRTIRVLDPHSAPGESIAQPNFRAENLAEATDLILAADGHAAKEHTVT